MKKSILTRQGKKDRNDSPNLSQSEAFLVASMLSCAPDDVRLTRKTIISGRTFDELMFFGPRALYLDLKPRNALETLLAGLIVFTTDAAHDCFAETVKNSSDLDTLNINAKYALKLGKASANLLVIFNRQQSRPLGLLADASVQIDNLAGLDQEITQCDSVQDYFKFGPRNVTKSVLLSLIISTRNLAATCFNEAKKQKLSWVAREIHLRDALTSVDTVLYLLDAFEMCRGSASVHIKPAGRRIKKSRTRPRLEAPTAEVFNNAPKMNGNARKATTRSNGRHT